MVVGDDDAPVAMGRQGLTTTELAERLSVSPMWLSRRIGRTGRVEISLEDANNLARALGVPVTRLLPWLPRLDSNQQPSGRTSPQVSPPISLSEYRQRVA